jgi:hypothetical protein
MLTCPLRARATALAIALAVQLSALGASAQVEADASAPADAAQEAFRRGNEHAKAKRWREALAAYEEAYRTRRAWDIAGNLGIAQLELGEPRRAAEHLDEALRGFPGSGKPEQRALLEEALARALASVGRLSIRTAALGSTVVVDGVARGTAPLGGPVFVEPGRHVVEVVAREGTGREEVEVAAGVEREVLVAVASSPSGSDGAGGAQPLAADDERPLWPAFVLGGVGVAGLGAGLGLAIAAGGASSDAEARVNDAAAAGTPCRGGESTGYCAEAADLLATSDGLTTGSVIAFVVGGAAAVGAITYVLWPDERPPSAALRVAPLLGPDLLGARGRVSF